MDRYVRSGPWDKTMAFFLGGLNQMPDTMHKPMANEENSSKTEIGPQKTSLIGKKKPLSLNERLGLNALIDEGMRLGLPKAPMVADLFNDLWNLMNATVSGSRLDQLNPEDSKSGLRRVEIKTK